MASSRVSGMPLPGHHLPYLQKMSPGCGIGGAIEGWALSEAIIGVKTHFFLRRTIPCTKQLGHCEGCHEWRRRAEWNGYAAMLERRTRDKVMFQFTLGCVEAWINRPTDNLVFRGSLVRLQRKGEDDPNGKVTMSILPDPPPPRFPSPPDLIGSLARMWRMDRKALERVIEHKDGDS